MRGWWLGSAAIAALAAMSPPARADIYVCVDANGRHLTSDRPILECIDREQTELSPSGQVLRRIGPSLTADERAAQDEKARRAAEERNRLAEEKRRDRALLARYPDRPTHDRERAAAITSVDDAIRSASRRLEELQAERRKLEDELEFYQRDPAKLPASLKRKLDEHHERVAAQRRFIADQEDEKGRVNARYDQELARLKTLWAAAP